MNFSNRGSSAIFVLSVMFGVAFASLAKADPVGNKAVTLDVVETLRSAGKFESFLDMIDRANLTEALREAPAVTVFAPTDDALEKSSVYPVILESQYLATFVNGHIVKGAYDTFRIGIKNSLPVLNSFSGRQVSVQRSLTGQDLKTLPFGGFFSLAVPAGQYLVNGYSRTTKLDTFATNGVIQSIDYPICILNCAPGSF